MMNDIVTADRNEKVRVVLDNLDAHGSKNDRWLTRRAGVS